MGYDALRFISKVEDEFYCPICTMVLEDAVQTPCEHIFCNACIKLWLVSNGSCPTDRKPLKLDNLNPAIKYFRNMLNRLVIKCDFQPSGCEKTVSLEYLKDHIKDCEYNPNAEIICDKGCNIKITRREYQVNNCFSHFGRQLTFKQEKISELEQELSKLKLNFERQIEELNHKIRLQEDKFKDILNEQRKLRVTLSNKLDIPEVPQKWRCSRYMRIDSSPRNVLTSGKNYAYAISLDSLEPKKNAFTIQILEKTGEIVITFQKGTYDRCIGVYSNALWMQYNCNCMYRCDEIFFDSEKVPELKVGDIIECVIQFPNNFINDGTKSANVYFSVNEQLITEKVVNIPSAGLFSHVILKAARTMVKYQQLYSNNFE